MPKIYKILLLIVTSFTARTIVSAQVKDTVPPVFSRTDSVPRSSPKADTIPSSVNVELENIFNAKTPKKYTLSHITVTGTTFDPNLIISISGLSIGDKITIPGGDEFANAITNLWKQNLVSDVEIYLTNLVNDSLSIEIHVTDRPILSNFKFKGISKTQADDITKKLDLQKGKVTRVTEGFRINAISIIKKYFIDKGYRNVDVVMTQSKDLKASNAVNILFIINKNGKVRINNIYFAGNHKVSDLRLKKQMKGTKEKSRLTLFPF
ncbi:MAG TPA: outer membrane protein assembly factor, partial [Hanamia sp.]|nr:outer membrane protein assembly factor [Hanamia sp.]